MSYDTSTSGGFGDLIGVVALLTAFDAVVLLSIDLPALRLALGVPFLLLGPGHALVTALYPRGDGRADPHQPRGTDSLGLGASVDPISPVARLGLTVAGSLATLAAVAAALNASPWAIRPVPVLIGVTVATLALVAVAAYRRRAVPAHLRYGPSMPWRSAAHVFRPRLSATFVLGLLLVASAVGASAVLATTDTDQAGTDEEFTEFTVLTADGDGDYVTGNYTDAIADDRPLYFELISDEGQRTEYTVVFVRETVAFEGNETVVRGATERARTQVTLADGATHRIEYQAELTDSDAPTRLRAYLYRGDAPDRPSRSSAYRSLQIWYSDDPRGTDDAGADETGG